MLQFVCQRDSRGTSTDNYGVGRPRVNHGERLDSVVGWRKRVIVHKVDSTLGLLVEVAFGLLYSFWLTT
jgi:hypothetical protein